MAIVQKYLEIMKQRKIDCLKSFCTARILTSEYDFKVELKKKEKN